MTRSVTLKEIAHWTHGRLHGDPDRQVAGAAILRDAGPQDITFVENSEALRDLRPDGVGAVLAARGVRPEGVPWIEVEHVHEAFARVVTHFRPPYCDMTSGISPAAQLSPTARTGVGVVIHPDVTIGEDVEIGDGTVIYPGVRVLARTRIGKDVTIFPNAVLYEDTVVGDRCVIHAGAVLGAYGFGYQTVNGRHERSAQLGYVVLEDDVEVGAGTTIDRGTYGPTRIGEGTKIDNLVMIAHNCSIGRHNLICSQVGIAGSCTTGDYVVLAGQVGLRDHVDIGDQAMLGAKAGVMHDIPAGGVYVGIPATPEREQMVKQAALAKLPEMRRQFRALQKQVADLEARLAGGSRGEAA